jgi:general L-amino acid transport system ATP-binding protein
MELNMNEQTADQIPIIIARDVHKWFGDFHALKGIDMEVQKGEVVVIFGPSGSGKSTFIRTINRLEEHQRGQIVVDGIELSHDVRNIEKIRMETGMVFQQFNLFPHLTVLSNVTLAPIWVRKRKKQDAEELGMQILERVGIPEQAQKYPGQLPCSQRSCSSTNPHPL